MPAAGGGLRLRPGPRAVAEQGGAPFIVPAMGSHGGATAEGQLEVLASYDITPESMGCEVMS
jgi:hypothetical protein